MAKRTGKPRLLIAVGGNAIHPGRGPGTVEEQFAYAARTGRALLPIMRADNELVITHGNGPVVGKILMRQVAPKVEAAIRFIGGGRRAVIAHLDAAEAALAGEAGTQVLP